MPARSARPARASCCKAHALVATSAQALNTPARKRRATQAANPSSPLVATAIPAVDTTTPARLVRISAGKERLNRLAVSAPVR
jgi:hypothetical protein